jgi:hypothetical protein
MSDLPMDSPIQRNNNINKGRKRRCGMRETEKDAKKSASSNSGPEISRRILVAEDNKAIQSGGSSKYSFRSVGVQRRRIWKRGYGEG